MKLLFKGTEGNLEYKTVRSCGVDLYVQGIEHEGLHEKIDKEMYSERMKYWEIPLGETILLPTGVFINQDKPVQEYKPEFLMLVPRSSIGNADMLVHHGYIDEDYPQEILIKVTNISINKIVTIEKGARIAQLILCKTSRIEGCEISKNTRTGGIGSTGK